MDYEVKLKQSDEGFAVWVPGLPGCASQGETEAEALENIALAIDEYLAALRDVLQESDTETRVVRVDRRVA
jgi:predicted RNase H-like HicB family nuclease